MRLNLSQNRLFNPDCDGTLLTVVYPQAQAESFSNVFAYLGAQQGEASISFPFQHGT